MLLRWQPNPELAAVAALGNRHRYDLTLLAHVGNRFGND